MAHGPSCSAACGIFPDQGSNPCPLHWQADSQPLRHQGSPKFTSDYKNNMSFLLRGEEKVSIEKYTKIKSVIHNSTIQTNYTIWLFSSGLFLCVCIAVEIIQYKQFCIIFLYLTYIHAEISIAAFWQ